MSKAIACVVSFIDQAWANLVGGPVVSGTVFSKMVRNTEVGASGWTLAGVDLPRKALSMGVSVVGAQGSGRSLALHDLIVQAERQDVRLFVNDPSGEFWRAHGKPENGDVYFNPASDGGVNWSIFSDLDGHCDVHRLAYAFLPRGGSKWNDDFFEDAARSLFAALVRRLAEGGAVNTNEIANAFFETAEDDLAALVSGTAAADALSQDAKGMRAGVMATLHQGMPGIQAVAPGSWSLREFLRKPKGNIYFVGDEAKFWAVKRLMIWLAMEAIKGKGEIVTSPDIKYLFVLNEYPVLGNVDIAGHLAEKRKFGVGVVVGMQAQTQLEAAFGVAARRTTMAAMQTLLQLRAADPKERKQLADWFERGGKRLIPEDQFGSLKPCQGYLEVFGSSLPIAKVDYREWFYEGSGSYGFGCKAKDLIGPQRARAS